MNKRQIKITNNRGSRLLNKERSYGSLRRVAMPRGLKGAKTTGGSLAMLEQHAMTMDVMNILITNAYRLGFKAGRAIRAA